MTKKQSVDIGAVMQLAESLTHELTHSIDDLSPADATRLQRELVILLRDIAVVIPRLYATIRAGQSRTEATP
jgi:hypothetical protein